VVMRLPDLSPGFSNEEDGGYDGIRSLSLG
jgi:hypothetical protein